MKSRRKNEIMKRLLIEQSLKTEEIAAMFGVSIETVRRDINDMEREGLVKKVYGGISLCSDPARQRSTLDSWNTRLERCHAEKVKIAARALELIPDEAVIALDIGTSVYELSRLLGVKKNLSIITNSLLIASELAKNTTHSIFCVGGKVTTNEIVTSGVYARNFLEDFAAVDVFLIGADGISLQKGITEYSEGVVDVKRQMSALAQRTVLLADHSKFGVEAPFKSCAFGDVDELVTDSASPEKDLEELAKLGVEVVIAE